MTQQFHEDNHTIHVAASCTLPDGMTQEEADRLIAEADQQEENR